MQKVKIAFILYDVSILGGAEKVSVNVANALSKYYEVYIVSLQGNIVYPDYDIDPSIKVCYLNVSSDRLRYQIKEAFTPLRRFLSFNKIDVALLEGNYCGFISSFARPFVKTKFIFCDHGAFLNQYKDYTIRYMRRSATLLCDHTVVLTEKSRNDYIDYFHIKDKNISCIYNWAEEKYINNKRMYDTSSRVIISVGRFGPEKGYDQLVKVANIILPKHKSWKWFVYGDGETFDEIVKMVENYGLKEQLILAGVSNRLEEIYSQAAFLVLPSYREGMPLVLLEAKSFKLPLVSFDIITGPGEIIQNGVNGFLITPYDIEEMARKVEVLIKDADLRESMSSHAYDNISLFRKDNIVKKWRGLLDSLISR